VGGAEFEMNRAMAKLFRRLFHMKIPFAFLVVLASLSSALAQYNPPPPQISVSGSAEVKVVPDEIRLAVAVETRAETLDPARVENDERVAAALAFLKRSGLADHDIKTDFISVYQEYAGTSHVKPVAYVVTKSIEIRLTNTPSFQLMLTGLLTNGVNIVNGVDFRTTQLRKYRDQARAMAIRAAKEKAQALTSELGVKLGKPASISVNDYGSNYGYYGYRNYGFGGFNGLYNNSTQNVASAGGGTSPSDDASDTFAAGQISVSATVNVSFLIN